MSKLAGVTPFPPEFAARYRSRGYWEDVPLGRFYDGVFASHRDRVAIGPPPIDRGLANPSARGDRLHRDGPRPSLCEQLPRRHEDRTHRFLTARATATPRFRQGRLDDSSHLRYVP